MNTEIAGIPAIRLEVVDLEDPVQVGENTTYEIRVKNQGSAEDLNVQVEGELPLRQSLSLSHRHPEEFG